MDDYKENVIELVRARPLLWDPRVPDYKDKDQKTQVWDELKELLIAPKGTTPKEVWESLIRCNNNALMRTKTNKKSGSGADKSKPWKFLKQMEFLNPIKESRSSTGNLPQESAGTEDDTSQTAMKKEADILSEGEGVVVPEQFVAVAEKRAGREQGGRKRKKKKVEDYDDDIIISLLRNKIESHERKPERLRMGFFNSIMPRIETLDDNRFQEFQMQTLQLLKTLCAEQTHQGHFLA